MVPSREDRFDIQVMRGVAVLAVVLFHAFPGAFGSGFLGVDVFFVLSGFLISGIILRGLERRDFSFKAFYIRRAKRLLPVFRLQNDRTVPVHQNRTLRPDLHGLVGRDRLRTMPRLLDGVGPNLRA